MNNIDVEKLFLNAMLEKNSKKIEECFKNIELWNLFYEIDGLSIVNFLDKNKEEREFLLKSKNLSEENFLFLIMLPNQTEEEMFDNILKRKDFLNFNTFTFLSSKFKDLYWFEKFFILCKDLNLEIKKDDENILSWVFSEIDLQKTKPIINFILENTPLTLLDALKAPIYELNCDNVNLILNIALEKTNSIKEMVNVCKKMKTININNDALSIINNTLETIKNKKILEKKLIITNKKPKIVI